MSKTGAWIASGLGGNIEKEGVESAADEYEKYHGYYGGKEEARKFNYTDMVEWRIFKGKHQMTRAFSSPSARVETRDEGFGRGLWNRRTIKRDCQI